MLCKRPGTAHACGRCLPCLINRRRVLTFRLMLEAEFSPTPPLFATFTYQEEPHGRVLEKTHLSGSIHRLRSSVRHGVEKGHWPAGLAVRFFGIGEYGDLSGRPHYHAALFGVPEGAQELCTPGRPRPSGIVTQCWYGSESHAGNGRRFGDRPGGVAGKVDVRPLDGGLAQYITGYLGKSLTRDDEYTRKKLNGRPPEFALASRNPGIGYPGVAALVGALYTKAGVAFVEKNGDVPSALAVGGKLLPIGRYLRGWLRLAVLGDHRQPAALGRILEARAHEEMAQFLPDVQNGSRLFERIPAFQVSDELFARIHAAQAAFIEHRETRRRVKAQQAEARQKISNSKRTI